MIIIKRTPEPKVNLMSDCQKKGDFKSHNLNYAVSVTSASASACRQAMSYLFAFIFIPWSNKNQSSKQFPFIEFKVELSNTRFQYWYNEYFWLWRIFIFKGAVSRGWDQEIASMAGNILGYTTNHHLWCFDQLSCGKLWEGMLAKLMELVAKIVSRQIIVWYPA